MASMNCGKMEMSDEKAKHRLEREEHVRHQAANRHLVLEDKLSTIPHGDKDARVTSQVGDRRQTAGDPSAALDDQVRDVDLVSVVRDLLLLHDIRTHSADVRQSLVRLGARVGQGNELLL